MVFKIEKRNGNVVDFDPQKITTAIFKAAKSVGGNNSILAEELTGLVQDYLHLRDEKTIHVETIQDTIEKVLIEEGHAKTAKSFILYRQKRKEIREVKSSTGVIDDCKLGLNAIKVLKERYLRRDGSGKIIESPLQMFNRVAKHIASVEERYGGNVEKTREDFLDLMSNLYFLPNSPMLMNAGNSTGQISAIFSLPINDSTEGIFTTLKNAATIHKRGGGTGFSFSRIRPRGDYVGTTVGVANGPLAFLSIFDKALNNIKQQGKRAGANMAVLRIDHPDILDFITCKESKDTITNFNLSAGITDEFMEAFKRGENYRLINPKNNEVVGELNAKSTFDLLATMAWKNGDPGVIFLDRINNTWSNPTPSLGRIQTTSPCGEHPLLPYESSILGSINLSKHVVRDLNEPPKIDFEKLRVNVHRAIHFLDNATDINSFHLPETAEIVRRNRKIGLGVMGFADMLIKLRIPYNSPKALEIANEVMRFINRHARSASCDLAKRRGVFPHYDISTYKDLSSDYKVRNATRTAISPTGTISLIASCSSSIEPLFALSYLRKTSQFEILEVNKLFEEIAREEGFYSEDLIRKISQTGSIQNIEEIPQHVKDIFVTSMDISPEAHVAMQATFQTHVDNAVSKTVNFPYTATVEDVKKVFLLAYEQGCKGTTIYRDGSHSMQVLTSFSARTFWEKKTNDSDNNSDKSLIRGRTFTPQIHKNLKSFT